MPGSVLVVDDALFMRKMLIDIFSQAGWKVIGEAENGEEAVAIYQQQHPDLVTMDIVMPVMGGIEALKAILQIESQARVVVCSALGQKHLILDAITAGARDFIVKPFQSDQVLEVAERVVGC
ncbi:MAG TPA: response regulator [Pelovirga sp.]|nr:response regulator [Pelovirga sp.]